MAVESLCIIKSGQKCIVGGHGALFDRFLIDRNLASILPQGEFVDVFHPNYEQANLQILRFDQCFKKMPHDASKCKSRC